MKPILIGITGGIGSGKSRAARFLQMRMECGCIDSDEVCRELLKPHNKGWLAIKSSFGDRFFCDDKTLNRAFLRKILFADKALRFKVNSLLHPLAKKAILEYIQGVQNPKPDKKHIYIIEVPLLFEARWQGMFDRIITVYADFSLCLDRLMKRDKITLKEAEKAVCSQEALSSKAMKADHVVDNSGPWSETSLQLIRLASILEETFQ